MRFRLLTAVRTLLADPRLVGRKDVVRLGLLVLMAKASHGRCRVEITARELGRWLGVSESTVDHEVLRGLREVDAVAARVLRGDDGLPTGVEYRVEALWETRNDLGAPLGLSKAELATLLRFLEGLFAPGWGEQCDTPAGLLVEKGRQGRGAASDRLALVLLALHARPDGRVPMVGGPLAKTVARHGRAAVTLARMLGCRVPVAATVLGRLAEADAVAVAPGRLVVPAVAAAHRTAAAVPEAAELESFASAEPEPARDAVRCGRCAGDEEADVLVVEGDGWRQLSWDDLEGAEERSGTAPRGLDDADGDLFAGQTVFETFEASRAAADPHTNHAVVADGHGEGAGGLGFSGEAASGYCRQPVRACEGGDSPAAEDGLRGDVTAVDGGADPLRGEKPDLLLGKGESGAASASTLQAWRAVSGGPPPVWAQVPKGLERVLEPVAMVWGRLDRLTTRRYVTKVVRARLGEIAGACGPQVDAERILRERLKRRLAEQGTAPVTDPVGWLVGRALPRRALCPDGRCDGGRRMDTRADCAACQMLVLDGRALRSRAFVKASTAAVGRRVDRWVFEAELNACWQLEAASAVVRREQALQERQAREQVWAERRAVYAVEEAARLALACTACGKPETAGLCGRCRDERRVEELVAEAVDVAVAACGIAGGDSHRLEVVRRTEQDMRGAVDQAVADLLAAGGGVFAEAVALAARLAAELHLGALQRRVVNRFAYQPPAQAEYKKVFATEMRRSHHYDGLDEARRAAEEAAQRARFNTAHTLLNDRLRAVRAARPTAEADVEPDWYAQAAARVRGLIRPAPPEHAVSVRRSSPPAGQPTGDSRALAVVGA
ncbi:hypothetical protein OG605_38700 (plasmid) [Streptomyces xanthophaeus]|uniref:hypothetical protein n=1 Tax=Streptomyces xanthophaeus TaxID=67385 RepID=UPI00386E6398|nr:hypothetical protein OG605_38700 [Streptomyces xanthophaeus]